MGREERRADLGTCREIAPGVYGVEVGKGMMRSNVYFVRSGSSWVLIDAALKNCGGPIRKAAESLFGANTGPSSILLTHDHPDHSGSALELARLWNCPVYVHPDELPLVDIKDLSTIVKYGGPLDRWIIFPLLRAMPRRRVEAMFSSASIKHVVQAYAPSAGVPGLPDWRCVHTPGHTPGHVAFFRTGDRVLITGDAIVMVDLNSFRGCISWGLGLSKQRVSDPPWYFTWNWRAAKESVRILAGLEPCVLAPGHGQPMSGVEMTREVHLFADNFSGPATEKRTRA